MRCIIPAAGRGTRLRPHTNTKPKALLSLGNKPLISHIMDSIIGRKNVIQSSHENPTYIESNSVTGNQVIIKEGCKLIRTRVNPNLIIPKGMTYIDKYLRTYEDVVQLSS